MSRVTRERDLWTESREGLVVCLVRSCPPDQGLQCLPLRPFYGSSPTSEDSFLHPIVGKRGSVQISSSPWKVLCVLHCSIFRFRPLTLFFLRSHPCLPTKECYLSGYKSSLAESSVTSLLFTSPHTGRERQVCTLSSTQVPNGLLSPRLVPSVPVHPKDSETPNRSLVYRRPRPRRLTSCLEDPHTPPTGSPFIQVCRNSLSSRRFTQERILVTRSLRPSTLRGERPRRVRVEVGTRCNVCFLLGKWVGIRMVPRTGFSTFGTPRFVSPLGCYDHSPSLSLT